MAGTLIWCICALTSGNLAAAGPTVKSTVEDKNFWYGQAKQDLINSLNLKQNLNQAKNIIFFLGDGMGISTVTAARIHKGQKAGKPGEEGYLSFEKFPHVGLVKTYNVDRQVPDSAGTATAYLCGVKANYETIGVDATIPAGFCDKDAGTTPWVDSILKWAQDSGKHTGFVTTTRVTHATPAGLYAHTPHRDWECDSKIPQSEKSKGLCKDIARQLIEDLPGKNIRIVLGGGRQQFDPNYNISGCRRTDGLDLIQKWKDDKISKKASHKFLENTQDLLNLDSKNTDYVLGLFSASHIPYEIDRSNDAKGPPGIVDMTKTAVNFLKKSDNGFFLLVEGGRIDHAHHENWAQRALEEAVAMDTAIEETLKLIDLQNTLVIITADHSHGFTINGYPKRGNPIFGIGDKDDLNQYYTTLMYATGPGFNEHVNNNTKNPFMPFVNATELNVQSKEFRQLSTHPGVDSAHGGEDVAVYATGPMSHLFHGVHEQSYVAHAMGQASCVGPYMNACQWAGKNGAGSLSVNFFMPFMVTTVIAYFMKQ